MLRCCWRQVSITVSMVSTKRLPCALCVPKESLRQITACRNARSPALFVGSIPSQRTNVHSQSRCSYNSRHMPTSDLLPLADTAQQQTFDFAADRSHATDKGRATDRAVAIVAPVLEQFAGHPSQVVAEAFGLRIAAVDQRLKIPFQMGPTPLNAANPPVHLGPIARHDAAIGGGQQLVDRRRRAGRADREDGEQPGHEGPQPSLAVLFFGRRFVGVEMLFAWAAAAASSSYAGRTAAVTWFCDLDRQRRGARLTEQRRPGTPPFAACSDGSRPSTGP